MNHDWLLFFIMAHLLLNEARYKASKGEWLAGIDALFALACVISGVLHLWRIHD